MPHCDQELLALHALGEPLAADCAGHLEGCASCRDELESIRKVVAAVRPLPGVALDEIEPVPPPPSVWRRIAADTGVPADIAATGGRDGGGDGGGDGGEVGPPAGPAGRSAPGDASPARSPALAIPPVPRQSRRGVSRTLALAVAAVTLVVGLAGGVAGTLALRPARQPVTVVVARTSLSGLPLAPSASGTADVVQTSGSRQLDIDVSRLGIPHGYYEVWLIDPTVTKMVPVGVLAGSAGSFALPAGVSLRDYPIVDISIQPLNGDPKHSGRSVLRGTIPGA